MADLSFLPDKVEPQNKKEGIDLSWLPDKTPSAPPTGQEIRNPEPWWVAPGRATTVGVGMAGGSIVGLASGLLTGGTTSIPGALIGATLGGAGAGQAYDKAMELTGVYPRPSTLGEATKKTLVDAKESAIAEMTGQIGGTTLQKILPKLHPYRKELFDPEGNLLPKISEKIARFDKYGIEYTIADIVPNDTLLAKAERLMEYIPWSSNPAYRAQVKKVTQLNQARQSLIEKNAAPETIEELGRKIKDEVSIIRDSFKGSKDAKVNALVNDFSNTFGVTGRHEGGATLEATLGLKKSYMADQVRKGYETFPEQNLPLKGQDIIPENNTQKAAEELLREQLAIKPGERDYGLIKRLKGYLPQEAEFQGQAVSQTSRTQSMIHPKMLERDPELAKIFADKTAAEPTTWYGMDKTRGVLLERNRSIYAASKGMDTSEARINAKLANAIDQDMSDYAQGLGGSAWETFQGVRELSRRYHEVFDKDILKVMQASPESIMGRILTEKNGVTLLRQLRGGIGEEAIEPLRNTFFTTLLDKATVNGTVNPGVIKKMISKIGNETFNELATPAQKEVIQKIMDKGIFFNNLTGKKSSMKTIDFIDAIMRKKDTEVVNVIFSPNGDHNVKVAQKLLSPQTMENVKYITLKKVLQESGQGNYLPFSSAKTVYEKGYDVPMKRLFGKDYAEVSQFIEMGKDMDRVNKLAANYSGTGPTIFSWQGAKQLAAPLAATSVIAGVKAAAGVATTVVTVNTLARMYFSPTARKYMLSAWKLDPASQKAAEYFGKALTFAGEEIVREPDNAPSEVKK